MHWILTLVSIYLYQIHQVYKLMGRVYHIDVLLKTENVFNALYTRDTFILFPETGTIPIQFLIIDNKV